MSNENEHTQESDYVDYEPDLVQGAKTLQCAMEVLESHDSLDESYQDISGEERFQTAASIMYKPELQGLPDPLLRQRLKLYFEVKPAQIVGAHHFSPSSAECFEVYRSGHFRASTMMTHSVNESTIKFVAKRNGIKIEDGEDSDETIDKLACRGFLTSVAARASKSIYGSFRNDIHHLNEGVESKIPDWHELAMRNLRELTRVESCVFGFELVEGAMRLHFPQHWDNVDENLVQMWARLN